MPEKSSREYRNMRLRVRADAGPDDDSRIVTGYASTFGEPYYLFGWDGIEVWEVVERGAFDSTDMSDVIMQYDHQGRVFARTRNNTLTVRPDDKGLFIEADLGGTELGCELFDEIRGGYTDKMSFGFTVDGEYEEREKNDAGVTIYTRHITSVDKLYDVSAVSIPANDGTSIEADATTRSIGHLTDGVIERIRAERLEEEKLATLKRMALGRAEKSERN